MIGKSEKELIKKIIGHRYGNIIQAELKEMSQFNKQGETYSSGHINNVMNGEHHKIIEDAIWSVVKKQVNINRERNKLLK